MIAPLLANNYPDPAAAWILALTPFALAGVTAASGGYAALAARAAHEGRSPGAWWPWVTATILFTAFAVVFSAPDLPGLFVLLPASLLCAARLAWLAARAAPAGRPPWLEGRSAVRLASGALECLAIAYLVGVGSVELNDWAPSRYLGMEAVRSLAAAEIAWGRAHPGPDGAPRYAPLPDLQPRARMLALPNMGACRMDLQIRDEGRAFTIDLYPTRVLRWPFNYVAPARAFRADQTGSVRSADVWSAGERFPSDAVVSDDWPVRPRDVDEAEERLRKQGLLPPLPATATPTATAATPTAEAR